MTHKFILLSLIVFTAFLSHHAAAETQDASDQICVIGRSYIPPMSTHHPHVIEAKSVDIIMWSDTLRVLEMEPWSLICKRICFDSSKIKLYKGNLEITIRYDDDIKVTSMKNMCKEKK